jgi:hypothetical protein
MKKAQRVAQVVIVAFLAVVPVAWGLDQFGVREPLRLLQAMTGTSATFSATVTASDLTATDDATVTDDLRVGGDAGVSGFFHVGGYTTLQDAGANNLVLSGDLTVSDDMSADDGTCATVTCSGGGTPGLTRGGNTTVQTFSGDGFASLGTLQGQGVVDVFDSIKNTGNGANCTGNTAAFCINDPAGFAWTDGSGTTVGVATTAGLISGDTGVSSGPFAVMWVGGAAIPEGSSGQGAWKPTTTGRGSKLRQVCCSCRVAGSGGTNGITMSLWDLESGTEVDSVALAGDDANACDDAAGLAFCGDFNYSIALPEFYTLQVKNTTDCAGNPTDCLCNVDVTR